MNLGTTILNMGGVDLGGKSLRAPVGLSGRTWRKWLA